MRAGIVLTGGTSMLPGIRELAEKVFGLPVKIGLPMGIVGLQDNVSNPIYATAVGLVKYGLEKENSWQDIEASKDKTGSGNIVDKLTKFFNDFF